ncbi:MAG: response regulator transcription factor [Dehalococcoidales bacterium]|nr:response regulator transcription factor [Dehalococcoidales bacterium]
MHRICLIAAAGTEAARIQAGLAAAGFGCVVPPDGADISERVAEEAPHLVLIETSQPERIHGLTQQIKQAKPVPVIALLPREMLARLNGQLDADDFIVQPADIAELTLRIIKLLEKTQRAASGEMITSGDLTIDMGKCEVTVDGRLTDLTYREYELLKFLASHPGRVYSREALLNRVWGYDFYGGDRTVDVHIRRLRSKIEDPAHDFIETVRNIGYRFIES